MSDSINRDSTTSASQTMNEVISTLLLAGVTLSAIVLSAGLVILALTGSTGYHEALSPQLLLTSPGQVAFPRTLDAVFQGALALKPFAVIELGVVLLIATPVFRVAASALLFLLEKDRLYVVVTLMVLVLLLVSIFWIG